MSMMKAFLTGRLYNGKKYSNLVEVPGQKEKVERSRFHGRVNFRDERGDWHFVDVVCLRDFGDNGGLVGWLEREYAAPADVQEGRGGRAIELFGYMRPSEREKDVLKKFKTSKGVIEKNVKVPYTHWEFVIEGASFATKDDEKWKRPEMIDGEDADEWDAVEDEDDEDIIGEIDDEEEDEEEETPPPPPKKTQRKKTDKQTKPASSTGTKKKKQTVPPSEDDFFED